ncbi:RING finger protein 222 [Pholidichthys leucotaenia]
MALHKEDSQKDARECPVCFESLSGRERTLSCGHVFCHDCLVCTVVASNRNGKIRDTIACPVCRHHTFIVKRQNEVIRSLASDEEAAEGQILAVPIPLVPLEQLQSARRAHGSQRSCSWMTRCFRGISQRPREQRFVHPSSKASQIFVISSQGRPMTEGDAVDVGTTGSLAGPQPRRKICTTTGCLIFLLSAFTLLAIVASTFPWIMLM